VAVVESISSVVVACSSDGAASFVVQYRSDAEVQQAADMPVDTMDVSLPPKEPCRASSMAIDPARHRSIVALPRR
jgi:hypothetical protein